MKVQDAGGQGLVQVLKGLGTVWVLQNPRNPKSLARKPQPLCYHPGQSSKSSSFSSGVELIPVSGNLLAVCSSARLIPDTSTECFLGFLPFLALYSRGTSSVDVEALGLDANGIGSLIWGFFASILPALNPALRRALLPPWLIRGLCVLVAVTL